MNRQKVNLFIVGSPKCGTTSLAEMLSKNKNFFLPKIKEPGYFAYEKRKESIKIHKDLFFKINSLFEYHQLYQVDKKKFLIDASTDYFDSNLAPKLIHEYNPNSKIIIILRPHIDFLISIHNQLKKIGEYENNFIKAMYRDKFETNKSTFRCAKDFEYLNKLKFFDHCKKYVDTFGKKNVLFLKINDLMYPKVLQNKISNFLDIDYRITQIIKKNVSKRINPYSFQFLIFLKKKIKSPFSNRVNKNIENFIIKLTTSYKNKPKEIYHIDDLPKKFQDVILKDIKFLKKYGYEF